MAKADRSVVRNQAYPKKAIGIRERHNERKNENYSNPDIVKDRSYLNIHFKQCEGTYAQTFDRMLADGAISTRGLKQDAKVLDELVFDVNTAYFERNGGYDYARKFFEETYRLAVKEAGGERYILSAVMHADERNKALSEQLGRDVFHYHLHVVYVPVVDKEIKWSKRCKDKSLIGTTKEVIHQVSHSKKWSSDKAVDEHGKPILGKSGKSVLISSYSLLQDRFFEHMQQAGYHDFQRGERGSTAEHLSVLDFKIQQEKERAAALEEGIQGEKKQLSGLQKEITVTKQAAHTLQEIEGMGKKTLFGKVKLSASDWKKVSGLAKEGVLSRGTIPKLKVQLATAKGELKKVKAALDRVLEETQDFREVVKLAPKRIKATLEDVFRQGREQREVGRSLQRKDGGHERE